MNVQDSQAQRILIVDDDRSILQVLKMRVELMGYKVTSCDDPKDAIAIFEDGDFSLLLTDQKMGEISGKMLMMELRKKDPFLSVIIMTAYGTVDDAVESMRQGAFNYIEKPVDTGELELQIHKALERRVLDKRLALERDLWSRAVESIGAGLMLLDPDGRILWMHQVPDEFKGKPSPEPGACCRDVLNSDALPCDECPLSKALESGKVQVLEHQNPFTRNWFLITFTPLKEPDGHCCQTAVLFMDITESKGAEQAKMERERLQGMLEMAGAVSHELSQPLQAMLGWSEIMLARKIPEPYRKYLLSVTRQVEVVKELISQINNITKYARKDYPGSLSIIDIKKASEKK